MLGQLTSDEQAQLNQTIEMFEVITVAQPLDYQSLEILKEAYLKLERQRDVVRTARRIASAYVQLGQLSSALLEYEAILQRYPDDAEVIAAMAEIQTKADAIDRGQDAGDASKATDTSHTTRFQRRTAETPILSDRSPPPGGDEGREIMRKIFVDGRVITLPEFDAHWAKLDATAHSDKVADPFIQILAEHGNVPLDKSIKVVSDRSRSAFIALDRYDIDVELTRIFPKSLCRRWCVLPFDRMSKSIFVATANPFNKQAEAAIHAITPNRVIWYLATPVEIQKAIEKLLR
jgi:tetratricopeptide (TPR) repeat protein